MRVLTLSLLCGLSAAGDTWTATVQAGPDPKSPHLLTFCLEYAGGSTKILTADTPFEVPLMSPPGKVRQADADGKLHELPYMGYEAKRVDPTEVSLEKESNFVSFGGGDSSPKKRCTDINLRQAFLLKEGSFEFQPGFRIYDLSTQSYTTFHSDRINLDGGNIGSAYKGDIKVANNKVNTFSFEKDEQDTPALAAQTASRFLRSRVSQTFSLDSSCSTGALSTKAAFQEIQAQYGKAISIMKNAATWASNADTVLQDSSATNLLDTWFKTSSNQERRTMLALVKDTMDRAVAKSQSHGHHVRCDGVLNRRYVEWEHTIFGSTRVTRATASRPGFFWRNSKPFDTCGVGGSTIAFVRAKPLFGGPRTDASNDIYLCRNYEDATSNRGRSAPLTGANRQHHAGTYTRWGVFVHELSHFPSVGPIKPNGVGGTTDEDYGVEKCLALTTARAQKCADTWEFFLSRAHKLDLIKDTADTP